MPRLASWHIYTGLGVLLLLAALSYYPGLSGPFLLDDFLNLFPLSRFGDIDSWVDLGRYAFTGSTSPLGRPLTLLTYVANSQHWPAEPWWFKVTGVGLHLLNGALLFWFVRCLTRIAGAKPRFSLGFALSIAALWLLHPIQVSAVLYISQRMTVLAATFTFAALVAYVRGRELDATQSRLGLILRTLAISLGGLLATFSKETGALLPLFALVLEATLLHPRQGVTRPQHWRLWSSVFLWLPTLALALYVLKHLAPEILHPKWGWQWPTDLLTQARVLFDYLSFVFLPFLHFPGLFHDDYVNSSSLFTPLSTVAAVAGILLLLFAAFRLRASQPVVAFGILWFFAGHALESLFPGLEPQFEYRNYVPVLGPLFIVAWYLCLWMAKPKWVLAGAASVLLSLGLVYQTVTATAVWGNQYTLAERWVRDSPESARAVNTLARIYVNNGELDKAVVLMDKANARVPDNFSVELTRLQVRCLSQTVTIEHLKEAYRDAAQARYYNSVFNRLLILEGYVRAGRCPLFGYDTMVGLLKVLAANPHYAAGESQRRLQYRRAVLLSEIPRTDEAVQAVDLALAIRADPNIAYNAARWLLQSGQPKRALEYVKKARNATVVVGSKRQQRLFGDKAVIAQDEQAFREVEQAAQRALAGKQGKRKRESE